MQSEFRPNLAGYQAGLNETKIKMHLEVSGGMEEDRDLEYEGGRGAGCFIKLEQPTWDLTKQSWGGGSGQGLARGPGTEGYFFAF